MSGAARRLVSVALVTVVVAAARRYFVPVLTRTTGTWMGGVDGRR